jgi:hypothetical protein
MQSGCGPAWPVVSPRRERRRTRDPPDRPAACGQQCEPALANASGAALPLAAVLGAPTCHAGVNADEAREEFALLQSAPLAAAPEIPCPLCSRVCRHSPWVQALLGPLEWVTHQVT